MGKIAIGMEILSFLRERKKMILLPILVILLLFTLFALFLEIPVLTPFIYALF